MKKLWVAASLLLAGTVNADVRPVLSAAQLSDALLSQALDLIDPTDLIRWKVGDTAEYDVSVGSFGKMGTMKKFVASEEKGAIWMRQEVKLSFQNEVIEVLLSREDGTVLKMRRNGKDEPVPNDPLEIISTEYADVTVPAGTFRVLYVVAKNKQVSKIELWLNPQETVMDGSIKTVMASQVGAVKMEMTRFQRMD